MKKVIYFLIILFFCVMITLSLRGLPGNPDSGQLRSTTWREDGPFELSPERGRFALTYSFAETGSVHFPLGIARFVVPDLGFSNGRYVSLFAPALSFITLPGYIIGKWFSAAQVGTFAVVSIFSIINSMLILKISTKLGANYLAATLSSIVFLFASPAYSYAVNLYQHHVTTFLVLLSILLYLSYKNILSVFIIFGLYGLGIPLDYPNIFLLFPIALATGMRVFDAIYRKGKLLIRIKLPVISGILGIILPLIFFFWFNNVSYGNPLTTLGSAQITSVKDIDPQGNPVSASDMADKLENSGSNDSHESIESKASYFDSRNLVDGLFILLISPDRGVLIFTPVILFGILGAIYYRGKHSTAIPILIATVVANLVIYSMWGDPWGGWAFGSRYLIPSFAILAVLSSVALTRFGKRWYFMFPFWVVLAYSVFVNTLGALTTSAMPPQVEATALGELSGKVEKYSWDRNWEYINTGRSKSFIFQTWAHDYVSSVQYLYIISGSIILVSTVLTLALVLQKNEKEIPR